MLVDFDITVLKVASANRIYNTADRGTVRNKKRRRWAIALKRTGKTYYTVGDQQILSDGFHPVLLPKGCSYSWRCVEEGECLLIDFDAPQELDQILSFAVTDNSFLVNEFLKIQKNLADGSVTARLESVQRVYGILVQLLKNAAKDYYPKGKQQLLQPAVDYISENYYDSTITNDRLAALCAISTVYFRKSFETAFGVSPIRYLHDFRIKKAKDLLLSDYGSIAQVAESVGYNGIYHFSKMFRQYTGLSPTQYVKQSRK